MATSFSENALRVLEARYLLRDANGQIIETPEQLLERVASSVARAEEAYGGQAAVDAAAAEFHDLMTSLEFLPNSPTLMNAGTPLGQLSACFVLPVHDSMADIFDTLKLAALIQQSGGGVGFSFSELRPRGDRVASTGGIASGPVSFMKIFDAATEHIRQGGKRRGANMGVLRIDHPDIESFIDAKRDGTSLRNFNLSVGVVDAFMQSVADDRPWPLIHPRTGDVVATRPARALFEAICEAAWATGDPGMLFLDTIEAANPTPQLGRIEATNPCGEVPLLPYEACNLGSIHLGRMVQESTSADTPAIDWQRLAHVTRWAIRFLDDVIDVSRYPDDRITRMVRGNRKVGLGVMGFAELLLRMRIPYSSERAVEVAEELMRFVATEAHRASEELAHERGPFPHWKGSRLEAAGVVRRNATCTSVAPTGTIGILAGTTPSIEPLFALAYRRSHVLEGETLWELNPLLEPMARAYGLPVEPLVTHVRRHGTLEGCSVATDEFRELFRTALEIPPEQHLRIQAAFQRHVDNAVSKTVNLPHDAPVDAVARIYERAWEWKLKGVTVYRYGSLKQQVLELGEGETAWEREHEARCDPHACKL